MLKILSLVAILALTGCATKPAFLDNRVVCTVSKDKAFVVSQWGLVGISAEIAKQDQEAICPK